MRVKHGVRALLVAVSVGEAVQVLATAGESITGLPSRTDMQFRIGAMAIASQTTILLQIVDEGLVTLDDTIDAWLPDYPAEDRVTRRMLADSSSGYADYVTDENFVAAFEKHVFREWTDRELLEIAFDHGMLFDPGTDFQYAHTNFIMLGLALSAATGVPYEGRVGYLRPATSRNAAPQSAQFSNSKYGGIDRLWANSAPGTRCNSEEMLFISDYALPSFLACAAEWPDLSSPDIQSNQQANFSFM
ncbi:serine hydrolase domain-containing protein [Hoeflea sp. CAU 1731]